MLTLYAFFIFALSSSVIAAPSGRLAPEAPEAPAFPPPRSEYKELSEISEEDKDLITGDWGRIIRAPWIKEEEENSSRPQWHEVVMMKPPPEKDIDWTYARDCDDFIRFHGLPPRKGVIKVKTLKVHRVKRQVVLYGTKYKVDRSQNEPNQNARLVTVHPEVPVDLWGPFLNNTRWVRESAIVGKVSNGVMVWRSPTACPMHFTGTLWEQSYGLDTLLTHD